jgi:putative sigma-54 modulation protein
MISGRHVAVTDGMREHARLRAEKLEHVSERLMRATITLSIEGGRQIAEVVASIRRHGELVAKAESHDMYLSIDQAISKIEKQLQKTEERFRGKRDASRTKRTSKGRLPPAEGEKPEAAASAEEEE